jgi:excisionase family DNA binding protein
LKAGAAAVDKKPPRIIASGAAATALAVKPRVAGDLLDCGLTKIYELLQKGELESFKDGRSRKITVDSIRARIARLVAEAKSEQALKAKSPAPTAEAPEIPSVGGA